MLFYQAMAAMTKFDEIDIFDEGNGYRSHKPTPTIG